MEDIEDGEDNEWVDENGGRVVLSRLSGIGEDVVVAPVMRGSSSHSARYLKPSGYILLTLYLYASAFP